MARPISHLLEREPQPANPAAGWPSSTGSFVLPHGFCSLWGCSSVQPCGAATVCVPLGTLCALAQSWMDGSTTAAPFLLPQPAAATQVPHQQQPSSSILFPCFFLVLFWFGFFPKWNPFCAQAFLQAGSQGWHGAGSTQTLLRLIVPSVSSWQWSPSDPAGPPQSRGSSWSCQGAPSFRYGPMVAAAQGDQG